MSKNYMAEVAALLGVELGEVFKISDGNYGGSLYYRLTKENGIKYSKDNINWKRGMEMILIDLLLGDVMISKLPWKPQEKEKYYLPNISNVDLCDCYCWDNDECDEEYYKRGIVCKTKEEAIALTKKMLAVAKEVEANG